MRLIWLYFWWLIDTYVVCWCCMCCMWRANDRYRFGRGAVVWQSEHQNFQAEWLEASNRLYTAGYCGCLIVVSISQSREICRSPHTKDGWRHLTRKWCNKELGDKKNRWKRGKFKVYDSWNSSVLRGLKVDTMWIHRRSRNRLLQSADLI